MKRLVFLLALFFTFVGSAQTILVRQRPNIPASTFTTGTAIVPGDFCCGTLANGTYNFASGRPPGDYKPAGAFTGGFSIRQADGAYRFVNTSGDVYGTQGVGQNHGISTTNAAAYNLYFAGLNAVSPFVVTGENGFQMPSASGGSTITIKNAVAKTPNASGATGNFGISGTNFYGTFTEEYFRAFNTGQEGIIYLGNTGASYDGTNYINSATIRHGFCYNLQRECVQAEHANIILIEYITSIDAGRGSTGGQTNNFQYHDNGPGSEIRYSVWSGAKDGFSIASHGLRMHHNYISWTAFPGQILRTDNQYFAAFANRLTGDSIIIENNCFKKLGGSDTYAIKIEERTAPIIIRNNVFDGVSTAYLDNRVAGFSNTITGTISTFGNTTGTCNPPTMGGSYSDPDNYLYQGLQSAVSQWYDWGFRGQTH